MSDQAMLLQYYVTLNWAQEIVSDIEKGAAKFQVTNDNGKTSDVTVQIREQQLLMIEILDDLVGFEFQRKDKKLHQIKQRR